MGSLDGFSAGWDPVSPDQQQGFLLEVYSLIWCDLYTLVLRVVLRFNRKVGAFNRCIAQLLQEWYSWLLKALREGQLFEPVIASVTPFEKPPVAVKPETYHWGPSWLWHELKKDPEQGHVSQGKAHEKCLTLLRIRRPVSVNSGKPESSPEKETQNPEITLFGSQATGLNYACTPEPHPHPSTLTTRSATDTSL